MCLAALSVTMGSTCTGESPLVLGQVEPLGLPVLGSVEPASGPPGAPTVPYNLVSMILVRYFNMKIFTFEFIMWIVLEERQGKWKRNRESI